MITEEQIRQASLHHLHENQMLCMGNQEEALTQGSFIKGAEWAIEEISRRDSKPIKKSIEDCKREIAYRLAHPDWKAILKTLKEKQATEEAMNHIIDSLCELYLEKNR